MSINLPPRQLSRSVPMHLQTTRPVISSTQISPPVSFLALLQPAQCGSLSHFQTSASSHRTKSAAPDMKTGQKQDASQQLPPPVTSYPTVRSLFRSEKQNPKPDYLRAETQKRAEAAAARARARVSEQKQARPHLGSLADNSLFADQQLQAESLSGTAESTALARDKPRDVDPTALELRNPSHLAGAINPKPERRARWHRRIVIRSVRQRGRLNKTIKLARSERSSLSKSHFFKTSMKKLAPLARQIAGKPIDEAVLQMRFSKKKAAQEVREHLLQAKNEAIVARGMGLGHLEQDANHPQLTPTPKPAPTPTSLQPSPTTTTTIAAPGTPSNLDRRRRHLPGTTIPSNPAHRHPTDIYISQAWINRGPYGRALEHRAMGRINILRPPHTGISVLLKEEKTRAREAADKEAKRIRRRMGKNMWTQLPDRKVTRQSQYLMW